MRIPKELKDEKDQAQVQVQVLSKGPIEDVTLLPVVDDVSVRGSVVGDGAGGSAPTREKKFYRVMREGRALCGGTRAKLHEGKVIDDLNYDVEGLRRQGIRLEPADADD